MIVNNKDVEILSRLLTLKRSYLDNCTIGKLSLGGVLICYTIELPWASNEPFKSCIPAGRYKINKHNSEDHENSFYLENENLGVSLNGSTPRTGILFHIANFIEDIVGCIGPGLSLHPDRWGVAHSKKAMGILNTIITEDDTWNLNII